MNYAKNRNLLKSLIVISVLTLVVSCGGGGSDPAPVVNPPPPSDSTPDGFTFIDQVDIEFDTLVQSDSIDISGIDVASTISITGGEYSIDGATFVTTDGSVNNGQSITVQQTSSSTSKTVTDVVLTVGGVSDTFSVTTILVLNADFVEKAEAITFEGINLFEGHVDAEDPNNINLDIANLQSGDLITIDIEFDVKSGVDEYAFAYQLVPKSLVDQLDEGSTMGEVVKQNYVATEGETSILFGSILITDIISGQTNHAVLQTKIPALAQDIDYQVVVSADIGFLTIEQEPQIEELALSPILIDDRILSIAMLENVLVKVFTPPELLDKNEFTHLELAGGFDVNGYSLRPIFESSIEVDITSFNASETIELSMNWITSKGDTISLGLVSSDDLGNALIGEKAEFLIAKNGGSSISVPIAAYLTEDAQTEMLAFATSIRDIADTDPESGQFVLDINYIEDGVSVDTEVSFTFNLPLVSQDLRAINLEDINIINFAVLRAGLLNNACLAVPLTAIEIDSGFLTVDSVNEVVPEDCENPGTPGPRKLWRYDVFTKQFINQTTDQDGNNYCLTAIDNPLIDPNPNLTPAPIGTFTEIRLEKCEFDVSVPGPGGLVEDGTAIHVQRFELADDKIKLLMNNHYLNVRDDVFAPFNPNDVELIDDEVASSDFFRDTDGLDLDENGRVFSAGDSDLKIAGIDGLATLEVDYSGDAFVDYKPVAGMTIEGKAGLTMNLFDFPITLVGASFTHKRYMSKQLTSLIGNIHPVKVENGTEVKFTLLGLESGESNLVTTEITESYNPAENVSTYLQELIDEVNDIAEVDLGDENFDEELFSIPTSIAGFTLTIKGSVKGELTLKGSLNQQRFGLNADLASVMKIDAVISADLNLYVAKPGVEGTVEIINKTLTFDSGAEFTAATPVINLRPQISFVVHSKLTAELKALKGKLVAFVDYRNLNFFSDKFLEIVRSEKTLYESGYLIQSGAVDLFSGEVEDPQKVDL